MNPFLSKAFPFWPIFFDMHAATRRRGNYMVILSQVGMLTSKPSFTPTFNPILFLLAVPQHFSIVASPNKLYTSIYSNTIFICCVLIPSICGIWMHIVSYKESTKPIFHNLNMVTPPQPFLVIYQWNDNHWNIILSSLTQHEKLGTNQVWKIFSVTNFIDIYSALQFKLTFPASIVLKIIKISLHPLSCWLFVPDL